jgi:hypothetical protein
VNNKQLDEMFAEPTTEPTAEPTVAPQPTVAAEPDPWAHLIGGSDPTADKDPFALLLDGMLADEGMSRETETPEHKTEGYEDHEWELKEELIYEEDKVNVICRKCHRQMRMDRTQTWGEAMGSHEINPDCGQMLVGDVMDS